MDLLDLLDAGAGLGKPNFHVAADPGVALSFGLEVEQLRWQLSLYNLTQIQKQTNALVAAEKRDDTTNANPNATKVSRVFFAHGDITNCTSLIPFTHVYSFDVGFPPIVMEAVACAFNNSRVQFLVSFQTPTRVREHACIVLHCVNMLNMCTPVHGVLWISRTIVDQSTHSHGRFP